MKGPILFFTDGSSTASRAGSTAIELASLWNVPLRAFFILDEGWGSMLGDEWINTSDTRMKFFRWFEGELKNRAQQVLEEFAGQAAAARMQVETGVLTGKTERVIASAAESHGAQLVVLPNPNSAKPAAAAGLKYNPGHLAKLVKCPILLGPNNSD